VTGTSTHASAITGKVRKKPGKERCCRPNQVRFNRPAQEAEFIICKTITGQRITGGLRPGLSWTRYT
jgi:hypothetical protein